MLRRKRERDGMTRQEEKVEIAGSAEGEAAAPVEEEKKEEEEKRKM